MKPEHLELQSADGCQLNLDSLYQIAPSCFTEVMGPDGKTPKRVVNFDVLRQLLGDAAADTGDEFYQFTWPGKAEARREAARPIKKTLRPVKDDSVDWDTTQNLYIEGDNLEVLKLLQKSYLGKVKMIYIDPPYNTGNDFVYDDDFSQSADDFAEASGDVDELGNRYRKNTDSNGRFHSDWCSMIYPRLQIARTLLAEDGVIFISIDDNEVRNLKNICDEIFGASNNQAIITYVRKTSGKQDSSNFMNSTEYILVYSKSENWDCKPLVASEKVTNRYNKEDNDGRKFRETDLRKTGTGDRREDRPLMWYPFYYNPQLDILEVRQNIDETLKSKGYIEIWPIKPDNTEGRWRWGFSTAEANIGNLVARVMPKYKSQDKYTVYEIDYIDKKGEIRTVKEHTFWDRTEFNSDNAMAEFKALKFSNQLFPFPKCSKLIKHICYLANMENGIVLDFFSGSATTAHAVMQLNAEDGGKRRFIMVQLPEETEADSEARKAGYANICEIGKERIRRAGKKVKEEAGLNGQDLDIGFRVFRVDESNMEDVYFAPKSYSQDKLDMFLDNVKADRTDLDLLFGAMLDWGVQLSLPMSTKKVKSEKLKVEIPVYVVNDGDLVACFARDISEEVIDFIAEQSPLRVLLRDSCFSSDADKINIFEQFKQRLGWSDEEAYKNIRVL